ncbi:heparanase-like protein 3 [Gossypium arboreum]|uniref:heparanase-like protein 3 n=1 Tax=Gossypium arboreum TaxID=29729 RepID=UPI0022F15B16|nr:heparanase-like protein 3 [Gossypium arboreum]
MCILFKLVLLYLWVHWVNKGSDFVTGGSGNVTSGTVFVNGTASIGKTDDNFICATLDWWPPNKCDYGTCSWERASLLNLDLSNPILLNAIKAFSSLKIRMGGTLQDKVIYETKDDKSPCASFVKNSSEMFGFSKGCLPMSRWDQLNVFFKKAGAMVVFGLNALSGKTIRSDGSATGAWNSSNAESLIRYTVNKGYSIHGWELGNELCGTGVGAKVAPDQYASDVKSLENIVQNIYRGFEVKPLVIAPGGFIDTNWFAQLIQRTPKSLQVVTQHIYNLGPGNDNQLINNILDPSYLDGGAQPFRDLEAILKNSATPAVAWVGEAGGAYNSGQNLVTNSFVNAFWYLDQLGMASSYDTKTYCRQTLIGGNYGLLNIATFVPNPDYYGSLLWHRLMGSNVLSTSFSGTTGVRAYAHCSKQSQGITLLLINFNANISVNVRVATEGEQAPRIKLGNTSREEYHVTAKDENLHSQKVVLNGKILALNSSGGIPPMEPVNRSMTDPIIVAPFSYVFSHISSIILPACIN